MTDPTQPVLVEHEEPFITLITLNRPDKRNALSVELIDQLRAAIEAAAADTRKRVLILRANGPAFCAGLDLKEAAADKGTQRSAAGLTGMYKALCRLPLITIAAAQGAAMGGGTGILAACDLVVAADDLRITYPEVHRGLVAALVSCLLRRQVSERHLRELILLGQPVAAPRALQMGLINHIVPSASLSSAALELARAAATGSPTAVARSKRLIADLSATPIEADLDRALQYHLGGRNSTDALEGMRAFVEKRTPQWAPRGENAE